MSAFYDDAKTETASKIPGTGSSQSLRQEALQLERPCLLELPKEAFEQILESKFKIPLQRQLLWRYREAHTASAGEIQLAPELNLGGDVGVIGRQGLTQLGFPLLNGETVGRVVAIGLPNNCSQVQLRSITKDEKLNGLWLKISATTKDDRVVTRKVLLLHKPTERIKNGGKREKTLIISDKDFHHVTLVDRLSNLYEMAQASGSVDLKESPLDLGGDGGAIESSGKTQKGFPLPNGLRINKQIPIPGLRGFSNFHLLGISYNKELNQYTLSVKGEHGGYTNEALITLSGKDGLQGHGAMIVKRQ